VETRPLVLPRTHAHEILVLLPIVDVQPHQVREVTGRSRLRPPSLALTPSNRSSSIHASRPMFACWEESTLYSVVPKLTQMRVKPGSDTPSSGQRGRVHEHALPRVSFNCDRNAMATL
jgi:hypothetical protein